jgi:hypothetical protein
MDGELILHFCLFVANVFVSIFAKADLLGNKCSRDLPTSVFDAAILEFQNCNGDLNTVDDDDMNDIY